MSDSAQKVVLSNTTNRQYDPRQLNAQKVVLSNTTNRQYDPRQLKSQIDVLLRLEYPVTNVIVLCKLFNYFCNKMVSSEPRTPEGMYNLKGWSAWMEAEMASEGDLDHNAVKKWLKHMLASHQFEVKEAIENRNTEAGIADMDVRVDVMINFVMFRLYRTLGAFMNTTKNSRTDYFLVLLIETVLCELVGDFTQWMTNNVIDSRCINGRTDPARVEARVRAAFWRKYQDEFRVGGASVTAFYRELTEARHALLSVHDARLEELFSAYKNQPDYHPATLFEKLLTTVNEINMHMTGVRHPSVSHEQVLFIADTNFDIISGDL